MSVVSDLKRMLSQAGLQVLETLAERLRQLGEASDDPLYLILESAALVAADSRVISRGLEHSLDSAYHGSQQAMLDELHALMSYGGAHVEPFAQRLWMAFLLGMPSASEALWDDYTELRRSLLIETGRSAHNSWAEWIVPLSDFFGMLRAQYELSLPDIADLFAADEVIEAMETPAPRKPGVAATQPVDAIDVLHVEPIAAAAAINNYLNAVLDTTRWAHIQGHPAARQGRVPLSDVYVPLRVIALRSTPQREDLLRFETPGFERYLGSDAAWQHGPGEASELTGQTLSEALDRHHGLLLMGPLGAGKTTLLRHLGAEHARILLENNGKGIEIETQGNGAMRLRLARPLPIYLRLADYLEQRSDDEDLPRFLLRSMVGLTGGDPGVGALLRHLLDSGQCLILLDGLDEAVSDEQARLLVREVQAAGSAWQQAQNHVIVASRSNNSSELPLLQDFEPLLLRPLDRAQVNTLALRWKLVFERLNAPLSRDDDLARHAQSETLALVREIATSARLLDLARRPLMLRLIAQVYHPGVALPARQAALLQVLSSSMIREWRLSERVSGPYHLSNGDVEQVLAELAFWLQSSRASGSLDERELRQICLRIWRELAPDLPLAHLEEVVHSLIGAVRTQNGPLIEVAPGRYGFAASGLREYFAAIYLVSSYRLAPGRVRALLHHPRWIDTIRLAVGIAALRSRDDASDLIRSGILSPDPRAEESEASGYEGLLHRDLLFAALVLGDEVEVRPDLARSIAERLMALWLNAERSSPGRFTWLSDQVYQRLARLDGTASGRYAAQIALDALIRGDERQQAHAADALTLWRSLHNEIYPALLNTGRSASPLVRQAVARALRRCGVQNRDAYVLLLGLAADPDERVSQAAQNTLEGAPPVPYEALQIWVDYLHSEDPVRQRLSLNMLQQIGALPPLVIGELLRLIDDPSSTVRQRAIEVLGGVHHLPDDALASLSRMIADDDPRVRVAAINALRRPVRLPAEVLEQLVRWTQDPNVAVRRASSQALGICHNEDEHLIEALIELLGDPVDSIREAVIEPLLRKGQQRPEVIKILAASLRNNLLSIRMAIADALQYVHRPGPELQQLLLTLLRDSELQVRQRVLRSVAAIQEPGSLVIEELVQMSALHDPRLAGEATRALANQRGLSDTALTAMVAALPLHWERAGAAVLTCLRAHLPLNGHVVNAIMDLAVSPEGARRVSTQVPAGLRMVAVEILGLTLSDTPAALQIMLDAAEKADTPEVRAAALRGLARAEALTPALNSVLQQSLLRQPLMVRLAAASALGELVHRLPDPNLSYQQLLSIAGEVKRLINDLPARAAWEPDAIQQDEALLALARISSRARRASLRLGASSEQP